MKRILVTFMAIAMLISVNVPAMAIDNGAAATYGVEETAERSLSQVVESKSEYQMAIEETQRMEARAQADSQSESVNSVQLKTPLEDYKEAFDIRAGMDAETLSGMGYSSAEIDILQKYNNGECTFEEAATRASAVLTPKLTCTTHTAEKYIIKYSWEWDKTPVGLGQDGFAMGLYGIDDQSAGFVTKLNSATTSVTYYYTDNTYYKVEYPDKDVSANTVSTKFDSYKLSDLGDRWVWAKKGYITMTVSPAVSGGKAFAAVRAAGEYGHASENSAKIDISVSVNVLTGDITTTFSIAPFSSGSVTPYGKKQTIFYNDGSEFVEA